MHNAAACCIIVSYFLLIFSWITGLAAVITKKVPVTLATCVLNMLIAVFFGLLIAIMHRKILAEEKRKDCFDLKIVFDIVCKSRRIKFGYSLGITWLALVFTSINGFCWFHITKMQKLLFTHGYYY
jgi:ABC-type antimicrobial peptide transport system permease subunit